MSDFKNEENISPFGFERNDNNVEYHSDTQLSPPLNWWMYPQQYQCYYPNIDFQLLTAMELERSHANIDGPGCGLNFMAKQEIQNGQSLSDMASSTIFIFHIPAQLDNWTLFQLFRKFGDIKGSNVVIDFNTGRSKGFGFVSYSHPSEAHLAVAAMNGFLIDRKKLKVSMKKVKGNSSKSTTPLNSGVHAIVRK